MIQYRVDLTMECKHCGHVGYLENYIITLGVTKGVGCKCCGENRDYIKRREIDIDDYDVWPDNCFYKIRLKMVFLERIEIHA
jgi:transcription elongation factor Elf1